jgi:threonylcarbamoyladenosine tRNA methylthiotransferase MtaB
VTRPSSFILHPSSLTFHTITLGCKVNQYETEYVREGFARLGYRQAEPGEPVDLCLVNTCTVTAAGEAKSRKLIRQFARQHPRAEIIVMGCYAARAAAEVAALPGVVEVVADKRRIPELLARRGLLDAPAGLSTFGRRQRAYVKVQDGCAMQCSYCIIPQVRPVLYSRGLDEVREDVGRLVDHGHREIVLVGIHLGHYGLEAGAAGIDLARLVRRLAELDGEFRLRISSLEAGEITPELIQVMADHPRRICPHLHISLQSGSDRVLERMRRRGSAEQCIRRCREVSAALDQPALGADVIVGFPGESEADFAATCQVVAEAGFSKLHVFRFSPRPGTPAVALAGRVPGPVQHRRAAELTDLGGRLRQRFFEGLLGRPLQVLVESPLADRPGVLLGTCERYTPVELPGGQELLGRLVGVTARSIEGGRIRGEPASGGTDVPLSRPTFGRCPERVGGRASRQETPLPD